MSNVNLINTSKLDSQGAYMSIERMRQLFSMQRKAFERRWYDNNFFDDGHHFRIISRVTGKVLDVNDKIGQGDPKRAIPKASRQIRGVANLLAQADYQPVIYPEQPINVPDEFYDQAVKMAGELAKKTSLWVQQEWKNQELIDKLVLMIILAAKNSVSYLQIWPDEYQQSIKTKVWDAFDLYLQGQLTDIYDSPVIVKSVPMLVNQIQSDDQFDLEQRKKLSPDNKYASSEIKEAYMRARYGFNISADDQNATVLLNEGYIKEYLDENNVAKIEQQEDADLILTGKKMGDCVIRQVMGAGGVWLLDKYTDLPEYPFVDFRFEPGPIYQTSLIERFIPSNKSLDTLMSRLEKYANTMVTGTWMKRKGESFDITNVAGAQVINYETTPPIQGQIANVPPFFFNAIQLLNQFIDEQGVSTSALNHIPSGVKANAAIESLKETEYANLKIATNMIKKTITRITERMLDIADKYFIEPQTIQTMDSGNPMQFSVVGSKGMDKMNQLGMNTQGMIPLKKGYKVEIEIESGAAYTYNGKKELINSFVDRLVQLSQAQVLNPEVVKVAVLEMIKIYKFGSTSDFSEAMDKIQDNTTETDLAKIKIAIAEVMKDLGMAGDQASNTRIMENKIGVVEGLKDAGMLEKPPEVAEVSKSISYKDAPPSVRRQIESQAGLQPASENEELLVEKSKADINKKLQIKQKNAINK